VTDAPALNVCSARALSSNLRRTSMEDHIYRVIELTGSSPTSIDDAIKAAIARASKTLRDLRWFEVIRTSGHLQNGKVHHFQVTLKVGFTMEEAA
jgi:flavin-binding protein dodecin